MRALLIVRPVLALVALAASLFCTDPAWSVTVQEVQALESRYNELYAEKKYREAVPVAEQLANSFLLLSASCSATASRSCWAPSIRLTRPCGKRSRTRTTIPPLRIKKTGPSRKR